MDPKKISSFAQLLKDNGDKLLNSGYKLTLSGPLLRALNDSFVIIVDQNEICPPKNFQVVKTNNSKSDAIRDLQFIHDFVQKTLILCITSFQADENDDSIADISKFRNLQKLEIQRFDVKRITGIQQLRSQLQEIVCVRKSITSVKHIISDCGGDNSNGFVWNELKFADFSSNGLKSIDCSLEFAPFLQSLNISHNQIVSVDAIKWLPHLKILDISYNKLTYIPTFNIEAGRRLQLLLLSNNFIEELSGISRLDALNELDLSGNCLLDHTVLGPISLLAALRYLNTGENPLSFCHDHRERVAQYLHRNTSSVKFVLDMEPLSKYEKSLTGKKQLSTFHSIHSSRSSMISKSSFKNTPLKQVSALNTPTGSVTSINSTQSDLNKLNTSIVSINMTNSNIQKKIKVRNAVIEEGDDQAKIIEPKATPVENTLEGKKEHIETKEKIENLRKKYGDQWLQQEGANLVHSAIGVEYTLPKTQISPETMIQNFLKSHDKDIPPSQDSPENHENNENNLEGSPKLPLLSSTPAPQNTLDQQENINPTITPSDCESCISKVDPKKEELLSIYEPFASPQQDVDNISEAEDNEVSYVVYLEPNGEEIFLIVSDLSIREKDISTGRTKFRWTIQALESCERTKSNIILINYDTIRKDKKQRCYKLKSRNECHKLENFLRDILSKRPLSEMNQMLFRCANCSAQFSREITYKTQNIDVSCPECRSTFVIEIKESPKLSFLEKVRSDLVNENTTMRRSTSHNSIGSVGSLNESSSCSKISNSESSFDSNQSVAGSSNSERDRDLDINGKESDIEILSNPSQSSIEVLDSIYSRKHSEERRISQVPTLDTITDDLSTTLTDQGTSTQDDLINNEVDITIKSVEPFLSPVPAQQIITFEKNEKKSLFSSVINLTESSSSGSVTDSICTAYEQNHGKSVDDNTTVTPVSVTEHKNSTTNNDKLAKNDSMISSMLNNLLQSTNILLSKSQKANQKNDSLILFPAEPYRYSYTNFAEVDHRLQLYLYQNVFEDENENFKWLAKGNIIDECVIEDYENGFKGLVVISTTKCYVLKIIGNENDDDPKNWLRRHLAVTIDRLEYIQVLPWKIGIELSIKNLGCLHLILSDILRTDGLLLYISNNLPDSCNVEYQISDVLVKKLLTVTNGKKIEMFGIIQSCDVKVQNDNVTDSFVICSLIVTELNLYVGKNLKWICKNNKTDTRSYELCHKQDITNLEEYKKVNDLKYNFYFMDDTLDKTETWEILFETETCAESTLNAISQSWEKLFDVPFKTAN